MNRFHKIISSALITVLFFGVSCLPEPESIEGAGPNIIRVDSGPDQLVVSPSITSTVTFATLWRDANSNASLNESVTITFSVDPALVTKYNDENGTTYLPMSSNYFSFSPSSITFAPGEFVKTVDVVLNAAGLDLANDYGVGLVVNTPEGWIHGGHKFVALALPSKYEGDYVSTGVRYNYDSPADANVSTWPPTGWTSQSPWSFDPTTASTINSKTVAVHAANSDGGFGRINLTVNADNSVTIVPNSDIALNALVQSTHRPSTYDPATETFELYYEYTNTSGTFRNLYHKLVKK